MNRISTLLCAATALVGLGASALADEPFKLGLLTSKSGTLAPVGVQVEQGVMLAIDEINAAGGLLGRQISVTLEDDESDPQVAARKAERLYQQVGVDFITGTIHSGGTLAVGQIAEREGKLAATTVSYATSITGESCRESMFRVNAHAGIQAAALVTWLAQNVEGDRYLILAPDYEMGRDATSMFAQQIEAAGKTLVNTVLPPLGATDFSTYFAAIRSAQPDVILTMTPGSDTVRLLTQLGEYGMAPGVYTIAGASGAVTAGNVGAIGEPANGFLTAAGYSAEIDTPENRQFVEAFRSRFNQDPDVFAVDSYSLVYLLKAAAEKAGALDTQALRDAIRGTTWSTPVGDKIMRAEDNQAAVDMFVIEVSIDGNSASFGVKDRVLAADIPIEDKCTAF